MPALCLLRVGDVRPFAGVSKTDARAGKSLPRHAVELHVVDGLGVAAVMVPVRGPEARRLAIAGAPQLRPGRSMLGGSGVFHRDHVRIAHRPVRVCLVLIVSRFGARREA